MSVDDNLLVSVSDQKDAETCVVQAAADSGESDEEGATTRQHDTHTNECRETVLFKDALQSLHMLRAYLEASGCQNCDRFYVGRKSIVQKTMKD